MKELILICVVAVASFDEAGISCILHWFSIELFFLKEAIRNSSNSNMKKNTITIDQIPCFL